MVQNVMHIGDPRICGSHNTYYAAENGSRRDRPGWVFFEKCPDCGSFYKITYPDDLYEPHGGDPFRTLIAEP
jgi:hypothetical protein